MPPEVDPCQWLAKAEDDLRSAQANLQPGFILPAQSMWASQQAAEKAIKAVLLSLGIRFPFTHDLVALVALLPSERRPPSAIVLLAELAEVATAMRYPSDEPKPIETDAQRGYATAAAVVEWVRAIIKP